MQARPIRPPSATLKSIKVLHTLVWIFFTTCIVAIPVASWHHKHSLAGWLAAHINS